MRLAAQIKGGYYPAALEAVDEVLKWITPPDSRQFSLLDPCAGEGAALAHIAGRWNMPNERVYGIELSDARARVLSNRLPNCTMVGPADFHGTKITFMSFGFIWLNPPFDDELGGGGRVEETFLKRAALLLATGGVVAFVLPQRVAERSDILSTFNMWFRDASMLPFPEDHRPFNEVVLLGRKRSKPAESGLFDPYLPPQMYTIPETRRPAAFEKSAYLHHELMEALDRSPLNKLFREVDEVPIPSPPLPPNAGQLGLLLASGQMDGIVRKDGCPPHLVKGVAKKQRYLSRSETIEKEEGASQHIQIYSERIIPVVRAVDTSGTLYDFTTNDPDKEDEAATDPAPEEPAVRTFNPEDL